MIARVPAQIKPLPGILRQFCRQRVATVPDKFIRDIHTAVQNFNTEMMSEDTSGERRRWHVEEYAGRGWVGDLRIRLQPPS